MEQKEIKYLLLNGLTQGNVHVNMGSKNIKHFVQTVIKGWNKNKNKNSLE
jgi:acid stress-induced BolA-like protein IbaG/YrbA